MKNLIWLVFLGFQICACHSGVDQTEQQPLNFLVLMSDNHLNEHLGCYGDPVVKTPVIDAVAEKGVRFARAFCASPSCTPARGAMLTGQDIWRLREGANLHSFLPSDIPTYADLLENAGYHVGHHRKGWGPGKYEEGGRVRNPAGHTFPDFAKFLEENETDKPWCFMHSSRNPHRPFEHGAGLRSSMNAEAVVIPPYLPDVPEVRADILDYYYQIQEFDREVEKVLHLLDATGQRERTVVVVCADNGWMMPRGLANLYDFGTRVPLIISLPAGFKSDAVVNELVSLNDLAPTFLELAGLDIPEEMTAASLVPLLDPNSTTPWEREFLVMGRERHALCREGGLGYPGRALRNNHHLLIHNYAPDRWPAGDPPLYGDIDLHMLQNKCPTKEYMMLHREDPVVGPLFEQAFLKRPEFELYDLILDPFQMKNLAYENDFEDLVNSLDQLMNSHLRGTGDPRARGLNVTWDTQTYYKESDWIGRPREEAQIKFGLEEEYSYR